MGFWGWGSGGVTPGLPRDRGDYLPNMHAVPSTAIASIFAGDQGTFVRHAVLDSFSAVLCAVTLEPIAVERGWWQYHKQPLRA